MRCILTKLIAIILGCVFWLATPFAPRAACPDRPACEGCGCKGGPGYRAPDGRCVGFKALVKTCGAYPHALCAFENAAGTGANKECALEPPNTSKKKSAPE